MIKTLTSVFILTSLGCSAQLTTYWANPSDIVNNVLKGSQVDIVSVSYEGHQNALSYFTANSVVNFPFESGILLSTGTALNMENGPQGPNNTAGAGFDNGSPGSSDLNNMLNAQPDGGSVSTFNAAVLKFDCIAHGDSISLNLILSSEEYLEYVRENFNDAIAVFIQGPGIAGIKNIALLPNGSIISVDKINAGNPVSGTSASNPVYYVDNGTGTNAPYNSSENYLQADGMTVPIHIAAKVTPELIYKITIVIADVTDGQWDSFLFIESESLAASVAERGQSNIELYPNPVGDELTIRVKSDQAFDHYTLIDLQGNIIIAGPLGSLTTISMAEFLPGMYLLQLSSADETITQKIQKL